MGELRKIPNVGKQTEQDLIRMGYTTIQSLRGKSADELYAEECASRGCVVDRCQLYLYRAVEYFVNTENPDPRKCKWWYWKDDYVEVSPCGAVCVECASFPVDCPGCRKIKGKVFWLRYTGEDCCGVYDCCVNQKGWRWKSQTNLTPLAKGVKFVWLFHPMWYPIYQVLYPALKKFHR